MHFYYSSLPWLLQFDCSDLFYFFIWAQSFVVWQKGQEGETKMYKTVDNV